jgi:hypothetical protein
MNQSTRNTTQPQQTITRLFGIAAILGAAISLTGCGASKPGTYDIAPFLQERIANICPRWDIADIRKVDGIQQGETYRVDFVAKMTFHADRPKSADPFVQCVTGLQQGGLVFDPNAEGGIKATKLDVTGWGVLTKSEKGWRLIVDDASPMAPFADLHLTFVPAAGS